MRTLQAAEIAGIRAILVPAISERVKRFYEKWGFIASPVETMTVLITVAELEKQCPANLNSSQMQVPGISELLMPAYRPTYRLRI